MIADKEAIFYRPHLAHSETCMCEGVELSSVRELRAWHWREVTRNRGHQIRYEKMGGSEARAKMHRKIADFHLKAVQTLNEFFAVGDTAEKDNR
jgi:hypothetical protein